jgi:hypothetical protein
MLQSLSETKIIFNTELVQDQYRLQDGIHMKRFLVRVSIGLAYVCYRIFNIIDIKKTSAFSICLLKYSFFITDLLSNRRPRNSYFSVTLKNMHQLHFSCKKNVIARFCQKSVTHCSCTFFELQLHFSRVTEK